MVAALLALAGATVLAYGWIDDQATAILLGFLTLLFALGLSQLPMWRKVRDTHIDRPEHDGPAGDLIDLSDVDWSALHRRGTPSQAAQLPRTRNVA